MSEVYKGDAPRERDRVKVVFEGFVRRSDDHDKVMLLDVEGETKGVYIPAVASVEVLDPAAAPSGSVVERGTPRFFQGLAGGREWKVNPDGEAFFRTNPDAKWGPCEATVEILEKARTIREVFA